MPVEKDNYDQRVFGMFGGKAKYQESIARLVHFSDISGEGHTLELCCGTGISTKHILRRTPNVVAVELNENRVAEARKHLPAGVEVLTRNALQLGKEHEQKYNNVLCINGFHYFNYEEFYRLARRVILPKGHLVFNVKLHDHHGVRPLHYRAYGPYNEAVKEVYKLMNRDKQSKEYPGLSDGGFLDSDFREDDFNDFLGNDKLFRIVQKQVNTILYDTEEAKQNYLNYWAGMVKEYFQYGHDFTVNDWNLGDIIRRNFSYLFEDVPKDELLGKAELFVKAEPVE
jgi:ubiquinone/menaquinone biosynthesis C-methylase UbiE